MSKDYILSPPDITIDSVGTERYPLAAWLEMQLVEHIKWAKLRIAAAKEHGIVSVWNPTTQKGGYVDRQGRMMIANSTQTEWTFAADFCEVCGASKEHLSAYGHLFSCEKRR